MEDIKAIFTEDIKEKQLVNNSVKAMNSRKSSKFALPVDKLTESQKRKLNGDVTTYNLKSPMVWKEFKQMPKEYQTEYLNYLQKNYGVYLVQIADMLKISNSTLAKYVKKNLPDVQVACRFGKKRMSKENRDKWLNFYTTSLLKDIDTQNIVSVEDKSNEVTTIEVTNTLSKVSMEFNNTINLSEVCTCIRNLLGEEFTGRLEIIFNRI